MEPAYSGAGDDPLRLDLTTKSFSTLSKRLSAHLLERHKVELTHTQVRTALSAALGFDSPNALDALLRSRGEDPVKTEPPMPQPHRITAEEWRLAGELDGATEEDIQRARRWRVQALRERLVDIIPGGAKAKSTVCVDLLNLILDLLAGQFPANLSASARRQLKASFPDANDELIAERAMNIDGVLMMLRLADIGMHVALDYFPPSFATSAIANDDAHEEAGEALHKALVGVYATGLKSGYSAFGASAIMVHFAAQAAKARGVEWPAIARLLIEAKSEVVESSTSPAGAPLTFIAQTLGISVQEAEKYLDALQRQRSPR